MLVLTEKNISKIFSELEVRIKKCDGIRICINQNKVNFENWVQVELCNILNSLIVHDIDNIEVEKPERDIDKKKKENKYFDIAIKNGPRELVTTVIAIKIIRVGTYGGLSDVKKYHEDISALAESKTVEKALLCVLYDKSGKQHKKCWNDVRNDFGYQEPPYSEPFDLKYNQQGDKTKVYLELKKIL